MVKALKYSVLVANTHTGSRQAAHTLVLAVITHPYMYMYTHTRHVPGSTRKRHAHMKTFTTCLTNYTMATWPHTHHTQYNTMFLCMAPRCGPKSSEVMMAASGL
jgi:hypothetical protein